MSAQARGFSLQGHRFPVVDSTSAPVAMTLFRLSGIGAAEHSLKLA